jgi:hypothetical protein
MLVLILQIVLIALFVCELARGILLSRRLAKIECQVENLDQLLRAVLRDVANLSLLSRRLDKEIKALQAANPEAAVIGREAVTMR